MDLQLKPPPVITFSKYHESLYQTDTVKNHGKVTQVVGLLIESEGPAVKVGEICLIYVKGNPIPVRSEVVGFKRNKVLLMPYGDMKGIAPGCEVQSTGKPLMVKVGEALRGRVLGGLGDPIDGLGIIDGDGEYPIYADPPNPITRPRIKDVMPLGVRAIDGLLTFGKGQRVGIFAGSGVGKSTTLSMIARKAEADINVLTLIGERGRELRDFLERDLGEEGMKRSVVVVATSDQPALVRLKGAYVGTAIAEYFRDKGYDVLLMMDSVTRFAMAQREVGLAVGEPPATKGYTPSCFALLPKLMERSGTSADGTITAIYTVLVEGDDMNEPIADTTRGILDGHIELSRKIAARNHYPAISIPTSVSRLFTEVAVKEHKKAAGKLREVLSIYEKNEDLINIGAYQRGSSPKVDWAISKIDEVNAFLTQGIFEDSPFDVVVQQLINMFAQEIAEE